MALATDLMGLGLPGQLALVLSTGGSALANGLAITAAGNSYATGATMLAEKRMYTCSNGNNTLSLSLPAIAGNAAIGVEYTVVNTGTDTVVIWAPSGVTISARGTNTSRVLVGAGTAIVLFPCSTAAWGAYGGVSS